MDIDNVKIWREVISEEASWIYNDGIGFEDAIHVIYSEENGFKPLLNGLDSGLGFYYVIGGYADNLDFLKLHYILVTDFIQILPKDN